MHSCKGALSTVDAIARGWRYVSPFLICMLFWKEGRIERVTARRTLEAVDVLLVGGAPHSSADHCHDRGAAVVLTETTLLYMGKCDQVKSSVTKSKIDESQFMEYREGIIVLSQGVSVSERALQSRVRASSLLQNVTKPRALDGRFQSFLTSP